MTNKQNKIRFNDKSMSAIKIGIMILIALISIFIVRKFSFEDIKLFVDSHENMAAIFYILIFTILPIFFFPVVIIVLVGGALFGIWKGSLYTMIGVVLNTPIMYYMGRFLLKDFVRNFVDNHMSEKLSSAIYSDNQKVLSLVLFIIRLSPIFSYNVVNYISGITEINFFYYLLTTFAGVVPGVLVFNYFGEAVLNPKSKEFMYSILFLISLVIISAIISKVFLKEEKK